MVVSWVLSKFKTFTLPKTVKLEGRWRRGTRQGGWSPGQLGEGDCLQEEKETHYSSYKPLDQSLALMSLPLSRGLQYHPRGSFTPEAYSP